ncbi:MAG: hypothetical protein V1916_01910, partial [Patescibacteria group bacterium]
MERGDSSIGKQAESGDQDLPVPEVVLGRERGPFLFSLVQAGLNPVDLESVSHPFGRTVRERFAAKPISDELRRELTSLNDLDSETRLRLSFAVGHPERLPAIHDGLVRDKGLPDKEASREWYVHLLEQFGQTVGDLETATEPLVEED